MKLTEYDPWRKNNIEYALDVGAPKFELVPVKQQKDLMVNAARMNAQQEYDRIMELVKVLQKQAEDIKRRLWLTDLVHAAEYRFQLYPGQYYWLAWNHKLQRSELNTMGPADWTTGVPDHLEYVVQIQWLGDQTWREVT
jgi:hypothetical protein